MNKKPNEKSVVLSVRLPQELYDRLRSLAFESDRSLNYVIKNLIALGLVAEYSEEDGEE